MTVPGPVPAVPSAPDREAEWEVGVGGALTGVCGVLVDCDREVPCKLRPGHDGYCDFGQEPAGPSFPVHLTTEQWSEVRYAVFVYRADLGWWERVAEFAARESAETCANGHSIDGRVPVAVTEFERQSSPHRVVFRR